MEEEEEEKRNDKNREKPPVKNRFREYLRNERGGRMKGSGVVVVVKNARGGKEGVRHAALFPPGNS